MVWPAVVSVALVLGSTALGVPDFTEIDRAFDVLARAATDGLIVTLEPVALLEEGDPLQHKRHKLCFWRGNLLCAAAYCR